MATGLTLVLLATLVAVPSAFAPPVPPGDVVWSMLSPLAGDDEGRALAVDPSGDFVIADDRATDTSDSTIEWFTLTPAGAGGGTGGLFGEGDGLSQRTHAVALDAGGAPFLAGSSGGTPIGLDYLLLRFNADGSFSGEKAYDGPAHRGDTALAVVTDAAGASYVTGCSQSKRASGDEDIVTIKYDAAGVWSWSRRYDGAAHGFDRPAAIAVRSGYVYVAGISRRAGRGDDVVVLKYNATSGALVWKVYYDGARHGNERVADLAVTASGIYVGGSGRSAATSTTDALLVKFAFSGARKWAKYTGGAAGSDRWTDLEWSGTMLRAAGVIRRAATGNDAMTAAYKSDGTLAWRRTFSSVGFYDDTAVALTTEATGVVYVACTCETDTDNDLRALAYDAAGDTVWASDRFGYFAGEEDVAVDIAVSGTTVAILGTSGAPALGDGYLVVGYQK
jgi:hypothetical protein